jgi:hypothetical protein
MPMLLSVANPMGLEWRSTGSNKAYAMCRRDMPKPRGRYVPGPDNWVVFGRVEPDITGKLVASATSFDHVKYVDSMEDGRLHVEAIWALEQ